MYLFDHRQVGRARLDRVPLVGLAGIKGSGTAQEGRELRFDFEWQLADEESIKDRCLDAKHQVMSP